ncbi:MAG: CoA-binding protein [Thermodesulfobacteriota bacterium]|nr:CoA-binding protein [Thermodesulfobacteriota bacterium]
MKKFFYPSSIAVFGVADSPMNLAKNIVSNSCEMGFKGDIFPVGRNRGSVNGIKIITETDALPAGIELAVILVPAAYVAETLDICGRKGISHAIISTAGFREYSGKGNRFEKDVLAVVKYHGIRLIGPNCIGVICTNSGLCTPFNPLRPKRFKKGRISLVTQSGGLTIQASHLYSEEHVGFSKVISIGNKLDLNEIDYLKYLIGDEDTEQIHLHLESIEDGRKLINVARNAGKPIVFFKSNVSVTSAEIAKSHTAALLNDDRIVTGAFRQAGIVRVKSIQDMTVCAKSLQLPPLFGNRLAVISLSGGFSVILGDACEEYGFECPSLPRELLDKIESFRRGGVIRMANPMDFGDVHSIEGLAFAVEHCLKLDHIDGMVLAMFYDPEIAKLFGQGKDSIQQILDFLDVTMNAYNKPIALSFLSERQYIEAYKKICPFPVFNDPVESVQALRKNRNYWKAR